MTQNRSALRANHALRLARNDSVQAKRFVDTGVQERKFDQEVCVDVHATEGLDFGLECRENVPVSQEMVDAEREPARVARSQPKVQIDVIVVFSRRCDCIGSSYDEEADCRQNR